MALPAHFITPSWTTLQPHDAQRKLWYCRKRFVAVCAGRGSGKTELAKRRLVRHLCVPRPWEDPQYFYGAPTEKQAKRIAWEHLLRLTPKQWIAEIRLGDLTIVSQWGVKLSVIGLDAPQRIEGVQWDGCVIDEASDIRPGVFARNLLPALSWRNGWCWRIGVPKRFGVGAAEFRNAFELGQAGENPEMESFWWPSWDILPANVIETARQTMEARDFEEQFGASWFNAGGSMFYAFDAAMNVRPCEYDRNLPLVVGSDFNVDPMTAVIGQVRNGRMEWIDEIWLRDANTRAFLDTLYARYSSHPGGFRFFGDATARARKTSAAISDYQQIADDERFKLLGRSINYPPENPPVVDSVAACNAMFVTAGGERRMFISPTCKRLIGDLQVRAWKPGTREAGDSGDVGHITDAMRYAIFMLFPLRAIRSDTAVYTTD